MRSYAGKEFLPRGFPGAPRLQNDGGAALRKLPRFRFVCFDPNAKATPIISAAPRNILTSFAISRRGHEGRRRYARILDPRQLEVAHGKSVDGFHALTTHATYFDYLSNTRGGLAQVAHERNAHDLGNGHAVLEYRPPWGRPIAQWVPAWGEEGRAKIVALRSGLVERFGAARQRIADYNRNLFISPISSSTTSWR